MNINKIIFGGILILLASTVSFTSCKKLALQRDYTRAPDTVDTHVYMSAWDYLKKRALGTTSTDQIWKTFYDGIVYSGMDTLEYTKPGRTYIFLNTEAITRTNSNLSDVGFFGANLVNTKNGTKWADYPKSFVKNYLQYLIMEGVHNHYTLPAINAVTIQTLAPKDSLNKLPTGITRTTAYPFVANPNSTMKIKVINSSPSNTS